MATKRLVFFILLGQTAWIASTVEIQVRSGDLTVMQNGHIDLTGWILAAYWTGVITLGTTRLVYNLTRSRLTGHRWESFWLSAAVSSHIAILVCARLCLPTG